MANTFSLATLLRTIESFRLFAIRDAFGQGAAGRAIQCLLVALVIMARLFLPLPAYTVY